MKNNMNKAVGLTGYFFTLPNAYVFLIGILVFALLVGIAVNLNNFQGIELVTRSLVDGGMLLALPALLSAAVIKLMIRKMPFRRIAAVTFIGELVYGIAYLGSFILVGINPLISDFILLLGAAIVFVLWYVIARLVFILKYRSILFAVMQLLFYLVFLFNSHVFSLGASIESFAKFYVASFVLFGALYIFFLIINAPMKKNLGFSSTDAFSFFISQWLYQNKDLEKALEAVGSRVRTLVTVLGFRREKGDVLFVTPLVHFGPFGNLGGSEFTYLIAQELDKLHGSRTFVFHGTVTHDLNPVSSRQIGSIINACEECLSESVAQPGEVSFVQGREAECRAEGLFINGSAFLGLSRAPYVTEDVNLGLGLSIIKEAEKKADVAMIADQHNAETGEITSFEPGDPVGYNYMKSVESALSGKRRKTRLRIGISQRSPQSPFIGKAGIKVAVVSSSPEYVIILIDSNGVAPDLNQTIESRVKEVGKRLGKDWKVGVYTTDTHQINRVKGVLNPLKAEEQVLMDIESCVEEASKDMADADFFSAKRWFDIDVLGAKQSVEIVSTVNSIVAVAKITLPLIMLGAVLLLFAIITRI